MAHADRTDRMLIFNPEDHPSDTLKSFDEFRTTFEFRYAAEFPDPPRVSMDAAIERWKVANTTTEITNPKPNLDEYDQIRDRWIQKDMVAKFIGLFSSQRLQGDWQAAEPNDDLRKQASWTEFVNKIRASYKPTENPVLVNYQFRALSQHDGETFHGFCNRVEKESKTCYFTCENPHCNADKIAVRDQVVIGTTNPKIREEALLKSWELGALRQEGMKIESAMRGESEISGGDGINVNKVGKYSYKTLRNNKPAQRQAPPDEIPRKPYVQQPKKTSPKREILLQLWYQIQRKPNNSSTTVSCKRSKLRKLWTHWSFHEILQIKRSESDER